MLWRKRPAMPERNGLPATFSIFDRLRSDTLWILSGANFRNSCASTKLGTCVTATRRIPIARKSPLWFEVFVKNMDWVHARKTRPRNPGSLRNCS